MHEKQINILTVDKNLTEAHIVQLSYVLWKNLTVLSTAYFDEPIDEVKGRNANRDVRWQLDVIAKF